MLNSEVDMLTPDQKEVARWIMVSSMAHYASGMLCNNEAFERKEASDSDSAAHYTLVSIELNLLSVELSLRLLLFVCFLKTKTSHHLRGLYNEIEKRDSEGLCKKIIQETDRLARIKDYDPISEKELKSCLNKHTRTYVDIRYFRVEKGWEGSVEQGFSIRDREIMDCLGKALLMLSADELERRSIERPPIGKLLASKQSL